MNTILTFNSKIKKENNSFGMCRKTNLGGLRTVEVGRWGGLK